MNNNRPLDAKHHWVSQFLLRNFSFDAKRKEVYVYERGEAIRPDEIDNIAQEPGFNTLKSKDGTIEKDDLEKIQGIIESQAAPAVQRIINNKSLNLSNKEWNRLSLFIGMLISATPWGRRIQEHLFNNNKDDVVKYAEANKTEIIKALQELKSDSSEEVSLRILDDPDGYFSDIKTNIRTFIALSSFFIAFELAGSLRIREWRLVESIGANSFVISDNPVIPIADEESPDDWSKGFLAYPIALPISPSLCLYLMSVEKVEDAKLGENINTVEGVKIINEYILRLAQKQVFSNTKSQDISTQFNKSTGEEYDKIIIDYEFPETSSPSKKD